MQPAYSSDASRSPDTASRHFIRLRPEHSTKLFFLRTIAAQIHALSALVAFLGILILARLTADHTISHFVTTALFGVCCVILFLSSALTHFLDDGFHLSPELARWLENTDKFSIYLVIASTYTAVLHPILPERTQYVILGLIWTLALTGCLYTIFIARLPRWMQSRIVYTGQFILLGWTALLCIDQIVAALTGPQLALILGGGATYSIGAVGYAFKWPKLGRYFGYHEIWHLSVLGGCLMFYILIVSLYR